MILIELLPGFCRLASPSFLNFVDAGSNSHLFGKHHGQFHVSYNITTILYIINGCHYTRLDTYYIYITIYSLFPVVHMYTRGPPITSLGGGLCRPKQNKQWFLFSSSLQSLDPALGLATDTWFPHINNPTPTNWTYGLDMPTKCGLMWLDNPALLLQIMSQFELCRPKLGGSCMFLDFSLILKPRRWDAKFSLT
jgi:hypothetical protein